jgi:uncharacterized membrane protein YeiH
MSVLAATSVHFGGFKWTGSFTTVDLIAAATNSLNGALLARRPDHYRGYTIVGIILMALLGGLGGGITRDIMVAQVPAAITNPAYVSVAVVFGVIGYATAYGEGQLFREGLFQVMTAFSLPWYAIVGAQTGVKVGLPVAGCLVLGLVGATAGRYYIDLTSGVAAKQFVRSEWFIGTAFLTATVWLAFYALGASTWLAAGGAFLIGFAFRMAALFRGWEEPMPSQPKGVHESKRFISLDRKIAGKSEHELSDLDLSPAQSATAHQTHSST